MKKLGCIIIEMIMGFIAVWWFIISCAMAFNVDHKQDVVFLIPVGWLLLIILVGGTVGINYFIYKKVSDKSYLFKFQIIPFVLGIMMALILTV